MQSILVISKDPAKGVEKAREEAEKNKTSSDDFYLYEFEKALGIEEFRQLQSFIHLKPINSPVKAVVINAFDGVTPAAQNSMLKILEEPPGNTVIYIVAPNIDIFLPTILSRVNLIMLENDSKGSEIPPYTIEDILNANIGQRLFFAQEITRTKEAAVNWIEQAVKYGEKDLREKVGKGGEVTKETKIIKELNNAYSLVKNTNVNSRLILENLFLTI